MKKYANIIIDNRGNQTNRPYTYEIGQEFVECLEVGMRVMIPFGRGNKLIKGLVVSIEDEYKGKYKLKAIREVLDERSLVGPDLIELSKWMSDYYLSPYIDSINTVLPPGDFKKIVKEFEIVKDLSLFDLNPREIEILEEINQGKTDLDSLKKVFDKLDLNSCLRNLEEKGILNSTIAIETTVNKIYENYIVLNEGVLNPLDKVGKRAYKQREIVEYLLEKKGEEISLKQVLVDLDTSLSTVKSLEEKNLILIKKVEVYREAVKREIAYYEKHRLNREQELAVDRVMAREGGRFLIHGITGSGKTEIYLQLVEKMIEEGKDSIILVPEIALTPQTVDRFVGRFGDNVAVLHSRLSFGERFDQWRKIDSGKVKIAVGPRSALFAPFKNLGLIVVDEEHETSYKSSMNPKYNSIEVAKKRSDLTGARLVLGSATPSIESYYASLIGEMELLSLKERANKKPLPPMEIVDMRQELDSGNISMFSRSLYKSLKENLEEKKQSILFLNRRGHSTFISCRKCGYVVKCNDCDVSMTYHRNKGILKCHYCGKTQPPPKICPECSSKYIKYFGVGTEQVEDFTREMFPEAVVDRMDLDTLTYKGSYEEKLGNMKDKKTDILIGTQVIAKGLDFENVTLVGVITADTSLNLPDFRAGEKTFQLITQVAGRAGRGDLDGRVIVQTYTPEHYSIEHAKTHNYEGFYKEEIGLREAFSYPPFVEIYSLVIFGENLYRVEEASREIARYIQLELDSKKIDGLLKGPYPSPLDRIKNNYRYHILLKTDSIGQRRLKDLVNRVCILNQYKINLKGIKYNIEVDPISIM